jgi:hypothetical protein
MTSEYNRKFLQGEREPQAFYYGDEDDLISCEPEIMRKMFTVVYSVALARKRTIPTERPPLVGEVSANFSG